MNPDGPGKTPRAGTGAYRILPWDSDFFGFGVARILPERLKREELAGILRRLREQSIRLVYWAAASGDPLLERAAREAGGLPVDLKTTLQIELNDFDFARFPRTPRLEEYLDSEPTPELNELAIGCGQYSRFAVDPGIGRENYRRLYRLWLREALAGKKAEKTLVYREDEGRTTGMISLAEESGRGRIVLISVSPDRRGRGIGEALCAGAASFFIDQGVENLRVVTQGKNPAACGLYRKLGFRLQNVKDFYHFWL